MLIAFTRPVRKRTVSPQKRLGFDKTEAVAQFKKRKGGCDGLLETGVTDKDGDPVVTIAFTTYRKGQHTDAMPRERGVL